MACRGLCPEPSRSWLGQTPYDVALPEEDRKQAIADAALKPEEKERIRTLNRAIEVLLWSILRCHPEETSSTA